MARRKSTPSNASTKQIRISTAYYPAVDRAHLPREIPYICLRGIWLINAGFLPGNDITVRISSGRLVITRT